MLLSSFRDWFVFGYFVGFGMFVSFIVGTNYFLALIVYLSSKGFDFDFRFLSVDLDCLKLVALVVVLFFVPVW